MKALKLKILNLVYYGLSILWYPINRTKSVAYRLKARRLTYLSLEALLNLARAVKEVESLGLEGDIIETGSALGGSAIMISSVKSRDRKFEVLDVFGMIPPPSENDDADVHERYETIESGKAKGIQGDEYYGYKNNLINEVEQNFLSFNLNLSDNRVELIPGLFEDTLHPAGPVVFAHIDCDWYDSVMVCLERITPRLVSNGVLALDDYYDWSGCRKATDDYFQNRKSEFSFERKANKLYITKLTAN